MPDRFEVIEEDCIGCGLCSERAPANFEIPSGTSMARILKQPETSAEEQDCIEACDYCPMGGLQVRAADSQPAPISAGGSTPADIPTQKVEN